MAGTGRIELRIYRLVTKIIGRCLLPAAVLEPMIETGEIFAGHMPAVQVAQALLFSKKNCKSSLVWSTGIAS